MISKNTFVTMINTISEVIEESKAICSCPIPGSFFMMTQGLNCLQTVIISRI